MSKIIEKYRTVKYNADWFEIIKRDNGYCYKSSFDVFGNVNTVRISFKEYEKLRTNLVEGILVGIDDD